MPTETAPHEHLLVRRHAIGEPGVAAPFAEVVWNRPDKRNALTPSTLHAFIAAIDELSEDDDPHAICVLGEGKLFCAGFDLPLCRDEPAALAELLDALSSAVAAMRACAKPVVLGAQGAALAGGCALLAGADLVIADRECKLGYPVANLGISPAVSAPSVRTRLGPGGGGTRRRLLDPGLVTAEAAQPCGLVDVVVDLPEDVQPRTHLETMRLADKPTGAVRATRRWLDAVTGADDAHARRRGLETSLSLTDDDDYRSRLASFLDRT
jgi:enoyl-CoA hydratase/carnithine racemase